MRLWREYRFHSYVWVQVITRQREFRRAPCALARQHLIYANFARLKFQCTGRHVQPPHAPGRFADVMQRLFVMRFKSRHPVPERQCVMRTQRLNIIDLKMHALHHSLDVADGVQLSVGEYVTVDEFRRQCFLPPFHIVRDAVV